jgi:hypothetical protein
VTRGAAPRTFVERRDFIEAAIADAERHGQESDDPDHEVGDLQDLVRRLANFMRPADLARAASSWAMWDAAAGDPVCQSCRSTIRLRKDRDPARQHCDACGWCGDPER